MGQYSEIITSVPDRGEIYFTNPGPDNKGFDYCYKCGHATIAAEQSMDTPHIKPYPDVTGKYSAAPSVAGGR